MPHGTCGDRDAEVVDADRVGTVLTGLAGAERGVVDVIAVAVRFVDADVVPFHRQHAGAVAYVPRDGTADGSGAAKRVRADEGRIANADIGDASPLLAKGIVAALRLAFAPML